MSSQAPSQFSDQDRKTMLQVARNAIAHELLHYVSQHVDVSAFRAPLRAMGAAFVTLKIEDTLRGCIGSLQARQPLIADIARNAGAAAFADPRFGRLTRAEFERIAIHISVLSASEPMAFDSQEDLVAKLRPHVDGLILIEGARRGTFLPDVWQQIQEPAQFLEHLKLKASLPRDYWSDTIQVERYTTESIA